MAELDEKKTTVYTAALPFARASESIVVYGGTHDGTYPDGSLPEAWLTIPKHLWRMMDCPERLVVAISTDGDFLQKEAEHV